MGFKIKQLETPYQDFSAVAGVGPVNLTAGVLIAEIYLGMYGQSVKTAGQTLPTLLDMIDNVTVTRRGQTIVDIENGQDLVALNLAPWFDHLPHYTSGASSAHYYYVKGLTLPCAYPSGYSGEFQLTVLRGTGSASDVGSEVISLAEGQGFYAHNYFGQRGLLDIGRQHFHIVKRLYDPTAAGWNSGFDIGTDGTLVGLLLWQTNEEDRTVASSAVDLEQMKLAIGGEEVIMTDYLTSMGRHGARTSIQSATECQDESNEIATVLDQYVYFDFARQPWDCVGKTVVFSYDSGSGHGAIRAYPIYLVPW